jgi:hypothetical protein
MAKPGPDGLSILAAIEIRLLYEMAQPRPAGDPVADLTVPRSFQG